MSVNNYEVQTKMLKSHYVEQLLKSGYTNLELAQLDLPTLRLKLVAVRSDEFDYKDLQSIK